MAMNYEYPLTNSRGLGKLISFQGLEFPVLVAPTLHGEPLLTAQAFYFLRRLESVARIRFEKLDEIPRHTSPRELERAFEYVIDNYLFAYSKLHPTEQLTSKITELKYPPDDMAPYRPYDGGDTLALAVDAANDDSVLSLHNEDMPTKGHWCDWCLPANYSESAMDAYSESMKQVVTKTVVVETRDHESLGTGTHVLPLLRVRPPLLTLNQARMLDTLVPHRTRVKDGFTTVSRGGYCPDEFRMPVEEIRVSHYRDPILLAYYFAGVREHLPISRFRCFYNVLEYLFEEATPHPGSGTQSERGLLCGVVKWLTSAADLRDFLFALGTAFVGDVRASMYSSLSAAEGSDPTLSLDEVQVEISDWLYTIRCAIVHSKKSRKGKAASRLVPYSDDEKLAAVAVPVLQYLAIQGVEKYNSRIHRNEDA